MQNLYAATAQSQSAKSGRFCFRIEAYKREAAK